MQILVGLYSNNNFHFMKANRLIYSFLLLCFGINVLVYLILIIILHDELFVPWAIWCHVHHTGTLIPAALFSVEETSILNTSGGTLWNKSCTPFCACQISNHSLERADQTWLTRGSRFSHIPSIVRPHTRNPLCHSRNCPT